MATKNRRFQLRSVVSTLPHSPFGGEQGHPYSHHPSRVGRRYPDDAHKDEETETAQERRERLKEEAELAKTIAEEDEEDFA